MIQNKFHLQWTYKMFYPRLTVATQLCIAQHTLKYYLLNNGVFCFQLSNETIWNFVNKFMIVIMIILIIIFVIIKNEEIYSECYRNITSTYVLGKVSGRIIIYLLEAEWNQMEGKSVEEQRYQIERGKPVLGLLLATFCFQVNNNLKGIPGFQPGHLKFVGLRKPW